MGVSCVKLQVCGLCLRLHHPGGEVAFEESDAILRNRRQNSTITEDENMEGRHLGR